MTPPDSSPSTHSVSKSPPKSTAPSKVAWLAHLALPIAFVPLALAFVEHDSGAMFFVTFGSVCVAAPCLGFWWGERRGDHQASRAALGCFGTVALFFGYFIWLLVLAPLIQRFIGRV